MKDAFVEFVRELQGTVRARRQEKIREVELSWSASELASFRLFVMGLHSSEMADVCYALSDAQAIPLLEILGDFAEKDPDLRKIAFQSMEKTSYLARLFLAKRLLASPKREVRARACEMLGNSGPQAQPLLEQALTDQDVKVQHAAIEAVSRNFIKGLGTKIISFLRSSDKDVRFAALGAVARLGVTSPVLDDNLLSIFQNSSFEEQTRRLAAGLLARSSNRRGRGVLLEALRNPGAEYTLRVAAAESLCGYDDPEAIRAVLCAVDDQDANIAKTARMALSRKNSQQFANILAQSLNDANPRIAELSAEVLGGMDAKFTGNILMRGLRHEQRLSVVCALAQAMSKGGIPGTWNALMEKQRKEKIDSPDFFSALADVAEEDNLGEFATLFNNVRDRESRRVILARLAFFTCTSSVTPEIEAIALRVLNEHDSTLYISAATIMSHVSGLDARKTSLILERLADVGEDQRVERVVAAMLHVKGGDLAPVFMYAPPSAAGMLAQGASRATGVGEGAGQLFRTVASWARNGTPNAKDALRAMAFLAPAALVAAMAKCADQVFLIEAWSGLSDQDRAANRPDFQVFFEKATLQDALYCIEILKKLRDPQNLRDVANTAFTSREQSVRKAAVNLARDLILAT